MSETKEPIQLERLRDFVRMVNKWVAKFPLKGDGSVEDCAAATEIYCCCEGAEENIYELQQLADAGAPQQAEFLKVVEGAEDLLRYISDPYHIPANNLRVYIKRLRSSQASEPKIESMVDALEPCPDCGSRRHKSCQASEPSPLAGASGQAGDLWTSGRWAAKLGVKPGKFGE